MLSGGVTDVKVKGFSAFLDRRVEILYFKTFLSEETGFTLRKEGKFLCSFLIKISCCGCVSLSSALLLVLSSTGALRVLIRSFQVHNLH
jgi:hypothetical protein